MWAFFITKHNTYGQYHNHHNCRGHRFEPIGFAVAKMLEKGKAGKILAGAKKEASSIINEAKKEGENIKKDKIFQAKEKFLELKAEHEKVIINKDKKIAEAEKRTRDKESQISSELSKEQTPE